MAATTARNLLMAHSSWQDERGNVVCLELEVKESKFTYPTERIVRNEVLNLSGSIFGGYEVAVGINDYNGELHAILSNPHRILHLIPGTNNTLEVYIYDSQSRPISANRLTHND